MIAFSKDNNRIISFLKEKERTELDNYTTWADIFAEEIADYQAQFRFGENTSPIAEDKITFYEGHN